MHACETGAERSLRKRANSPVQRPGSKAVLDSLRHHSSPHLPSYILPATFLCTPVPGTSTRSTGGPHRATLPSADQQQGSRNTVLHCPLDDHPKKGPCAALMDPTSVASQVHALLAQHKMSAGATSQW
eukprot:1161220-Pelagomonas_calceolata.AAC.25